MERNAKHGNQKATIKYLKNLIQEEHNTVKCIASILEDLNTKLGSKLMETTGTETEVDLVIEDCITQERELQFAKRRYQFLQMFAKTIEDGNQGALTACSSLSSNKSV